MQPIENIYHMPSQTQDALLESVEPTLYWKEEYESPLSGKESSSMDDCKVSVKMEDSRPVPSRPCYEQNLQLITCNNSKADVIKDANMEQSQLNTNKEAYEAPQDTPKFTTERKFWDVQQFIRDTCSNIDQVLQKETLEKVVELLKTHKDSYGHKNPNSAFSKAGISQDIKEEKQIIWKLGLDPHGFIRYAGANQREVFGRTDLNGFNFFDELMASYNKTYFQEKFGKHPLLGMQKPTNFLRFSLQHLNDDMQPIIITWKVVLLYTPLKRGQTRQVKGAKIFARKSGSESTQNFQGKIMKSTVAAGKMAITQLKHIHFKKQATRAAMINTQLHMYHCEPFNQASLWSFNSNAGV